MATIGCGESSADSTVNGTGASAGQGGGPASGGANNGKGGSDGGTLGKGSGGAGGSSGGVVGSGGASSAGVGGESAGGSGSAGIDCRATSCEDGLTCVPDFGVCDGAGSATCLDLNAVTCVESPVCGCDGTIYESNCAALTAGVWIAPPAQCTAPTGMMACVDRYCDVASEYCQLHRHYGSTSTPFCQSGESYEAGVCNPLPNECPAEPSCDCVPPMPNDCLAGTSGCSPSEGGVLRSCFTGCYG